MNIIEWRTALLESEVPSTGKLVGLVLSQFYRPGRATHPAKTTIASLASIHSHNTVDTAIKELKRAGFIEYEKKRLKGNKFDLNVYKFNGVDNVDTSKFDTSNGGLIETNDDVSIDVSIDVSKINHEIEEEEEVVLHTSELNKFNSSVCVSTHTQSSKYLDVKKDLPEWYDFAKKHEFSNGRIGASDETIQVSYEKFYDFYRDTSKKLTLSFWKGWFPDEKRLAFDSPPALSQPLEGEDLKIDELGKASFLKKIGRILNEKQEAMLADWENRNGKVWWSNIVQYKQGVPP